MARKFTQSDSADRFARAMAEMAIVGALSMSFTLLFLPLWVSLALGVIAGCVFFWNSWDTYRFQVPENTSKLLIGPSYRLQVGPGNWWKFRGEDLKLDNVVSTGVRQIEVTENVEGSDTGNRVSFTGEIGYLVVDTDRFNSLGDKASAESVVRNALSSHFKSFCDISMGDTAELQKTEKVVERREDIRQKFLPFLATMSQVYLGLGIQISSPATLIKIIDYDAETKASRRTEAETRRKASVEAARIKIITDVAKVGGFDPLLALAADAGSGDVTLEEKKFNISVTGDPQLVMGLQQMMAARPDLIPKNNQQQNTGGKNGNRVKK